MVTVSRDFTLETQWKPKGKEKKKPVLSADFSRSLSRQLGFIKTAKRVSCDSVFYILNHLIAIQILLMSSDRRITKKSADQ